MEEKPIKEEQKGPKLTQKLEQKFKTLEQEWQTFSKSSTKTKPQKTHHKKYNKSEERSSVRTQMRLLESSPRELMSSLQHPTMVRGTQSPSPSFSTPKTVTESGEVWRVRENELAQIGVGFGSGTGKLKGRRLFEGEDEVGFCGEDEIKSVCTEIWEFGERRKTGEVKQGMLCFGTGEGEVVKEEMNVKRKVFGVSYECFKVCFVVVLLAFVLGVIGGVGDEFQHVLLIPT